MTASPDDPALENDFPHIHAQFIEEGNKAFAKLNFLNASVVLATTPGLDVYQWKRSKQVDYYVHLPHAASDISGYRMFGIDYYDAILLSGQYQVEQVRALEKLRALPAKEIVKVGIPYMDDMLARLHADPPLPEHERTVLLAPSWGESAISKNTAAGSSTPACDGYHIHHPPAPAVVPLRAGHDGEAHARLSRFAPARVERDADNYDVLRRSDIMISDFSGVIFDFALVYDKPVIYADTEFDKSPYDAWWLDKPLWTFTALPRIGEKLTPENMSGLRGMIDACLTDPRYEAGRQEVRAETWEHPGEGAVRAANYLLAKYQELKSQEEGKK